MNKSWGEIGDEVGLEVVVNEEVEQEEEDREVKNILMKGKETKRKLATGTQYLMSDRSNKQCTVQYTSK